MTRFGEKRASSLQEEEEGEEHEQIRLVATPEPEPIIDSKMNDFSKKDNPYSGSPSSHSNSFSINHHNEDRMQSHLYSSQVDLKDLYANCMSSSSSQSSRRSASSSVNFMKKCQCTPVAWLFSLFPILSWLPKYNWKKDITYDLIAGTTVCVMHIPQGMGYALLGNLPPIVGIYMAFFPVIVYTIMGTSRHISMGTFAVICLMTGKVATERLAMYSTKVFNLDNSSLEASKYSLLRNDTGNDSHVLSNPYTIEQIATAISFTVGLWQILMGVLRLGSLCVLLSSELVSGFTTGAAIHVFTSQIKNLLGLVLPRRSGLFKIPKTYYDIFSSIGSANITAIILSLVTITCLVIYNEFIKPLVAKKIPFPIPVELLTIVIGTLVSRYWITSVEYGISIVNDIPTGLPTPALPPMEVVADVVIDGLVIAIVAYTISISMANIFAYKHNYKVNANQELIANGASNFVGGFFSCAPISASLSRSLIQEQVGGRTQLAGLFSCFLLVFVLLWIGPFFETLPHCVLSSMIIVALKGMFMQFQDLPKAWKESYLNSIVWISSFLSTVILDIEYGLGVGLILSIFSLIWKSNRPVISVLGVYHGSNIYTDLSCPSAKEIPGIKIIKYIGSLNFVTIEFFLKKVERILPPSKDKSLISRKASGIRSRIIVSTICKENISDNLSIEDNLSEFRHPNDFHSHLISWLILDFSSVSSIDPASIKLLIPVYKTYFNKGIQIIFSGCPSPVIEMMHRCNLISTVGIEKFSPSVHDAVTNCCTVSYDYPLLVDHDTIEPSTCTNNNLNGMNPDLKLTLN